MVNETTPPGPPEMPRGGCLTAFLVLMIVANAGTALLYFLNPGPIIAQFPRLGGGPLALLGVGMLLNIVLATLVWQWRRVGVYGFIAVALVVFPINLYVGIPLIRATVGLAGPLILALLVRPKWAQFR